jgi:hypothetical protein
LAFDHADDLAWVRVTVVGVDVSLGAANWVIRFDLFAVSSFP